MEKINDTLFIIPARGGSKGLPRKNVLELNGKPLICYTIDAARGITDDGNICVSTDDEEIIEIVENYGLKVHFKRPEELSSDTASSWDVVAHALNFYEKKGAIYKRICLLQPTSPLRNSNHISEAIQKWETGLEMLVSVKQSKAASVICSEDKDGFLAFTLNKKGARRQDVSTYYECNGAIYILDVMAFKRQKVSDFKRIIKYVMSAADSIDIDSDLDFRMVNSVLKSN